MNGPIWLAWVIVIIMLVFSVILLTGKGCFLLAGYNTMSKEKKQKYDEKKLCRISGCGLAIISIILAISAYYEFELPAAISWLYPWGIIVIAVIIIVLGNTVCKKRDTT